MKKRLEAELISIAHRILKLKSKSELKQLHQETQKLYEALSVLRFVEENINIVAPKMNVESIEEKLAIALDKKESVFIEQNHLAAALAADFDIPEIASGVPEIIENEIIEEPIQEKETEFAPIFEILKEEKTIEEPIQEKEAEFIPVFEIAKEEKIEFEHVETPVLDEDLKKEPQQISFEDLLKHHYVETIFEKVSDIKTTELQNVVASEMPQITEVLEEKTISKNSAATGNSKTITFALNDRLDFEKQLFGGSTEDMNRVVSQLSTLNSFEEAQQFLNEMVKPDYNHWEGKLGYEERFMEVVGKKF
jgi:hypothetical protein